MSEIRKHHIRSYLSNGQRYTYHRPTGERLPDLPLDHPDMIAAIESIEKRSATRSKAFDIWGGTARIPAREQGLSAMLTPAAPAVVAFSVPHVIRFIFRASEGDVIYYHHGNLLEDGRRDPHVRQKGRYIALCVSLGLLNPRRKQSFETDTHYFATRTAETATNAGLPRNVISGTITPDEYDALNAINERQASISTSRAIRDTLGISDTAASEMRNEFIHRGWLTNSRPPALTDLGLSLLA